MSHLAFLTAEHGLARRIARATDLLRTRVDLTLERQNRDLLASMDRRAGLQLRLQGSFEGLSTVAITYYLSNLVGYLAEGLGDSTPVDPSIARAASVPILALLVWRGVRRVRRRVAANP